MARASSPRGRGGRTPLAMTALSAYARFRAVLGLVLGVLIAAGLFVMAAMVASRHVVKGTVTDVSVSAITVSFSYAGKDRTASVHVDIDASYVVGDEVRLDVGNPAHPTLDTMPPSLWWLLSAAGVVVLVLSVLQAYLVFKFRSASAVVGGVELVGDFTHAIVGR